MICIGWEKPGENLVSRMIAGHDEPKLFSHCAVWFDDNTVCEAHINFGVRFRQYAPDAARWYMIPLPVDEEKERAARLFLELETGCGYDTCGVLAIAGMPLLKSDPERWFCSELTTAAMQQMGLLPDAVPHLLTPNGLYTACVDAGITSVTGRKIDL